MARDLSEMRKEIRKLSELINADVRTADRLISVDEACQYLGKKKSSVYNMIKSGYLPARRDGNGRYQLSFNQVQKFIRS